MVVAGFLAVWLLWRGSVSESPKSFFKVRESDKAHRTQKAKAPPSQRLLTGIKIDGPAHEILGISQDADRKAVIQAHAELMKRFHPDKLGPPGSQRWKDGQAIAAAINGARDSLLKIKS